MPIPVPPESRLPAGAVRQLVLALHDLYRGAGMPGTRAVSLAIRRDSTYGDTVSHEVVGMLLRGSGLTRWTKFECVIRQLLSMSVMPVSDPEAVVRRFFSLWLAASDVLSHRSALGDAAPPKGAGAPVRTGIVDTPRPVDVMAHMPTNRQLINNLRDRNPEFVGRTELLEEIWRRLDRTARPVALVGQGGIGKTEIALEYAFAHLDRYDTVWWFPAEHSSMTRASFRELEGRLGLGGRRGGAVDAVLNAVETSDQRRLLIFDNVRSWADLSGLIPGGAQSHVLMTMRTALDDAEQVDLIEVPAFSRAESLRLLVDDDTPQEVADRAAELLGDLPLAVCQVQAVRRASGLSLSSCLDLFENHLDELVDQRRAGRYPTTLGALVDLALRQVASTAPAALQLIEMAVHLSPGAIPLSLLRDGQPGLPVSSLSRCLGDPTRLNQAVQVLARAGLISSHPVGRSLTLHRLVRTCIRRSLGGAALERGLLHARLLLAGADPGNPDDSRTWGAHALIAPHVHPADLVGSPDPSCWPVVIHQARFLFQVGDYSASRDVAQLALEAWRRSPDEGGHGPFATTTVAIIRRLANALRALGRYEEARELTSETLVALRSSDLHGSDHELTLEIAVSAGVDLRISGAYREALHIERQTQASSGRVNGDDHPLTITVANNVGVSLRLLGEFNEARRVDVSLRNHLSRLRSSQDLLVLTSELNLAWDLYGLGEYRDMLAGILRLESALEPRLLPAHELALVVTRSRVVAHRVLGQLASASPVALEAHRRHHRLLGPRHERSMAMAITYGYVLRATEDFTGALDLAEDTLAGSRRAYGWAHPLTSVASTSLAAVLRVTGRAHEARAADERALDCLLSDLGATHPYAIAAANGLAGDLLALGQRDRALAIAEQVVEHARVSYSEKHPAYRACLDNLASASRAVSSHAGTVSAWLDLDPEPPPA